MAHARSCHQVHAGRGVHLVPATLPFVVIVLVCLFNLSSATLYISNSSNVVAGPYVLAFEAFDVVARPNSQLSAPIVPYALTLSRPSLFLRAIILIEDKDSLFQSMKGQILKAQEQRALAVILRMPDGDCAASFSFCLSSPL